MTAPLIRLNVPSSSSVPAALDELGAFADREELEACGLRLEFELDLDRCTLTLFGLTTVDRVKRACDEQRARSGVRVVRRR